MGAVAEVDPDQEAALRRLRAAFGLVEILRIIDHEQDQHEALEDPRPNTLAATLGRPEVGTEEAPMGDARPARGAGVLLSDEEAMQIIAVLLTCWRATTCAMRSAPPGLPAPALLSPALGTWPASTDGSLTGVAWPTSESL